jgi:murein L,D-transpeptidase YafK
MGFRATPPRAVLAVLGTYLAVLGGGFAWAQRAPRGRACPPSGTLVQVDTRERILCLCRDGRSEGDLRVALGRSGIDKRREGDGKSPVGRYPLGRARASSRYRQFLPVGYPTESQRRQGLTGSEIGIHGPHIAFAWLGHATAWPNWTRGCFALGTRGEVDRVARWVVANEVTEVLIR